MTHLSNHIVSKRTDCANTMLQILVFNMFDNARGELYDNMFAFMVLLVCFQLDFIAFYSWHQRTYGTALWSQILHMWLKPTWPVINWHLHCTIIVLLKDIRAFWLCLLNGNNCPSSFAPEGNWRSSTITVSIYWLSVGSCAKTLNDLTQKWASCFKRGLRDLYCSLFSHQPVTKTWR